MEFSGALSFADFYLLAVFSCGDQLCSHFVLYMEKLKLQNRPGPASLLNTTTLAY